MAWAVYDEHKIPDGSLHITFIRDAEKEIKMLNYEGYVEVDNE